MGKLISKGCLKIGNAPDREAIANLLFKHGYTVSIARCKINNKFEYFVKYELIGSGNGVDISEQEAGYDKSQV